MSPCVVMGRGHSGTRVVAWMCSYLGVDMGADAQAVPSGDPADRSFKHHLRVVATQAARRQSVDASRDLELNRFQKAVHGFHSRRRMVEPWGWKFPECYLTGPHILATFPRARFIHLLRDGRDLAFKRHLTDVKEHRLARVILRRSGALDLPHHLQAAHSWAFQVTRYVAFEAMVPADQKLMLRYEDVVCDPIETAERIAAFLGLAMTDACREYATERVRSSDVASFRRASPGELAEVEATIGDVLAAVGYPVPHTEAR